MFLLCLRLNITIRSSVLNIFVVPDPVPLFLIPRFIGIVGSQLWRLLIFNFLRNYQIQEERDEGSDREASLEHKFDSVEKAGQCPVVALVGEDIREPPKMLLADRTYRSRTSTWELTLGRV